MTPPLYDIFSPDWPAPALGILSGIVLVVALLLQTVRRAQTRAREAARAEAAEAAWAELEQEAAQQQRLLDAERERRAAAEERAGRVVPLEQELERYRARLLAAERAVGELRATLDTERQAAVEKQRAFEEAQARLVDTFKALSHDALQINSRQFLDQARLALEQVTAGAKTDLSAREKAVAEMVTPIREALTRVDAQIREMETTRAGAYEQVREMVGALTRQQEQLRAETAGLVRALRTPQARGRWGEIQLRRVVEMAGMLSHCDFTEQLSVSAEGGRLRPDMIVRMPGGRTIVVDAKTPLDAYLDATNADLAEGDRAAALARHARHVREHLRQLGQKAYAEQFEQSPDFVVLFLPGEAFFSAALERDPALIETGAQSNVVLATPTTLIALLRAVHYGWRQEMVAENARRISALGADLHRRVVVFARHMAAMGRALDRSVETYNKAVGSLERNVLSAARRLEEWHVGEPEAIAEPAPIEERSRPLQKLPPDDEPTEV